MSLLKSLANVWWQSLPEFGSGVLYAILVAAAYTFAVAVAAGTRRPRLLQAARLGAYGTFALVGLAVLVLAFAFVSHDFRISYVARYSERALATPFLFAALWGGQDGSLLWWLFLTSVFAGICIKWLGRRYLELQPYVIATLMSVVLFFGIIMVFAVNPFAVNIGGTPVDGDGLNYQLRNFYMIIHPPSLYIGFTSAAVPFAFAIAALVTGRLDNEWINASRKWMLFSWLFLSIGNALGMLWAYEELGWGGYWAWDPVENAAFLPWLTASAYVHSTMIQERRGMLKMWNIFLICMTFFLTIFGTFLTRSGLIASVHSFAQSGIGIFFVYYMGFIIIACLTLIIVRSAQLRSLGRLESALSRETAFVLNNWGLLGLCVFIAMATVWPRISEWLLDQKSTVGPTFYNFWIPPVAVTIFLLMGVAPLLGWRKTSPELFKKSFIWPVSTGLVVGILHFVVGPKLGFPPIVKVENLYPFDADKGLTGFALFSAHVVSKFGQVIAWVDGALPGVTIALSGFNVAVVIQEYVRGVKARQQAARAKNKTEGIFQSLVELVARSRRRYGGYTVHVGIVLMFIGFVGRAWGIDKEITLAPGEKVQLMRDVGTMGFRDGGFGFIPEKQIVEYEVVYAKHKSDVDTEKRMIFAELEVYENGKQVGTINPAKYIYHSTPGQPSTEVARYVSPKDDLYATLAMMNSSTHIASFQFHVNPLVSYIWIGAFGLLILGALMSLWPDIQEQEVSAFAYLRAAASVATAVMFSVVLAKGASMAYGRGTLHGPPLAGSPPAVVAPADPASATP